MRSYGQFCPVAKAADLFCERWTPLILRDLIGGSTRFSELQRGMPLASPTLLSRRLKQLEAEGIIERRRSTRGGSWTYHLTAAGREFQPMIDALALWGQRWSRRSLADHEVDIRFFIWSMQRGVRPDAFGARRTVVRLELTDQPRTKRNWWFVNEDGSVDLCLDDPGYETDVYLTAGLRDMIYLQRGDLTLREALASGRLLAHGAPRAVRALPRWFAFSPVAHIRSVREGAKAA